MPPNGHALALEFNPDELEAAVAPKPDAAAPILVDLDVGDAVAAAVGGLGSGVVEYCNGGLTVQTKAAGGERLAKLAMAMLAYTGPDADFLAEARAAGRGVLLRNFDSDSSHAYSPAKIDRLIGVYIDGVFEVVVRVVETERAFRIAMAN